MHGHVAYTCSHKCLKCKFSTLGDEFEKNVLSKIRDHLIAYSFNRDPNNALIYAFVNFS